MTTPDYRICALHFGHADRIKTAIRHDSLQDVQHRLRNMIANVRSIFRRTAATSDSVQHLTSHFLGRLDAIARIESHLALAERLGLELHNVVMDELAAFAVRMGEQAFLDGPDVRLRTAAATTLALIFHELANNSIKFGALGSDRGEVRIRWWIDPDMTKPVLHIVWQEMGGEGTANNRHLGFGAELLTKTLPFEWDGSADIDSTPGAYKVHISLPLTERLLHEAD